MNKRGITTCDVLRALGLVAVGIAIFLTLPALFLLVGEGSGGLELMPLANASGTFLPGIALLVLAWLLDRRSTGIRSDPQLLEGLARCATCGGPLGSHFGLHHETSRGHSRDCPHRYYQARPEVLGRQVSEMFQRMVLPATWPMQVPQVAGSLRAIDFSVRDRLKVDDKLRQADQLYADRKIGEETYQFERQRLEFSLAYPWAANVQDTMKPGEVLQDVIARWKAVDQEEKAKMLGAVLDGVYCDLEAQKVIAVEPKNAFRPLFALCEGLTDRERLPLYTNL